MFTDRMPRRLSALADWNDERVAAVALDRASPGRRFADNEGVGLARKLALDHLTRAWANGVLRAPWLRTTDADVQVPRDYLAAYPFPRAVGGVYPFVHPRAVGRRVR